MGKINKFNLHTHSNYCDGKGVLSEFVDAAIRRKLDVVGFSSHAPIKFQNHFSIEEAQIRDYVDEIRSLNILGGDKISLFTALECDYIPHFSFPFSDFRNKYALDYLIGGVHLVENVETRQLWFIDGPRFEEYDRGLKEVFGGDVRKGVTQYFRQMMEMVETQKFEVLAHLDKIKMHNQGRFFSEDDLWYRSLCLEVVDLLKNREIVVEVNTRGIYKKRCPDYYPSGFVLQNLLKNKVRITLSSDAHHPDEISLLLDEASFFVKDIGYKGVWCIGEQNCWVEIPL